MLDALKHMGHMRFDALPFGEMDAAALSQVVYLNLHVIEHENAPTLALLYERLKDTPCDKIYEFMLRPRLKTLEILGTHPRWRDLVITRFVDVSDTREHKQFCAMTLRGQNQTCLAYRGTDLTLTGFKEDLDMTYKSAIPAQRDAFNYLIEDCRNSEDTLFLTGHSKGGNLALYAGVFAPAAIRQRIRGIWILDSPGLRRVDRQRIPLPMPPIINLLPQTSIVGIIFRPMRPFHVIACRAPGLLQHNPYYWLVKDFQFRRAHMLSLFSRFTDDALDDWLNTLTAQEQKLFIDTLYTILSAPNEDSLGKLFRGGLSSLKPMIQAFHTIPAPVKKTCFRLIRRYNIASFHTLMRYLRLPVPSSFSFLFSQKGKTS